MVKKIFLGIDVFCWVVSIQAKNDELQIRLSALDGVLGLLQKKLEHHQGQDAQQKGEERQRLVQLEREEARKKHARQTDGQMKFDREEREKSAQQQFATEKIRSAEQLKPSTLSRLSEISYSDFNKNMRDYALYPTEVLKSLNDSLGVDVSAFFKAGYVIIETLSLFKGPEASDLVANENAQKVQEYKIHFMPKTASDVMLILEHIFKELKNNDALKNVINSIKFKPGINFTQSREEMKKQLDESKSNHKIFPIIVVYVNGKDNAQYALDTFYNLFKDLPGLDLTPRFNEKITSLIYYAQSDGDVKPKHPLSYIQPNMEVFVPDYVNSAHTVDYHLRNPAELAI